jgi:hypothetical protein
MICYPSLITSSNVYCCNSSAPAAQCRESARQPPQCLPDTRRCTDATGGGCCPNSLICSPNGCIQIKESSIIGPSSSPQAVSGSESIKSLTAVQTDPATVTVTQIPAATVTMAKEAEVAQKGDGSKQSVILSFCVPYVSAWSLLCVAVLMGMM